MNKGLSHEEAYRLREIMRNYGFHDVRMSLVLVVIRPGFAPEPEMIMFNYN